MMVLEEIGSLLLRITVGVLFLMGAWASGKDAAGRRFTVSEAARLFTWRPDLFAMAGIFIMGAGGLSVLLGVLPRLGALGLAIFLVPAAMIHMTRQREAGELTNEILAGAGNSTDDATKGFVRELGESAGIGHFTSALKNLSLVGPCLYLTFAGARPPLLIGYNADWQLEGILTRL